MPEEKPPARRAIDPSRRSDLLRDFLRPSRGQITVGIALFVTSLLISLMAYL